MTYAAALLSACFVLAASPPPAAPPRPEVMLERMTTAEVGDALARGRTTVLLFSGSTEATGPHVVLGKHNHRAPYLAERIAHELRNALVAPVIPFAPVPEELKGFPGTFHCSPEVFALVNGEAVESLVRSGFKYVVLMGDHGGNQEPLSNLAPKLDAKYRAQGARVFYAGAVFDDANEEIADYLRAHGYPRSGHGGIAETSEIWAVDARLLRLDRIAMGEPVPKDPEVPMGLGKTGVAGDPRRSSAELGKILLDIRVRNAVREIRALVAAAGR